MKIKTADKITIVRIAVAEISFIFFISGYLKTGLSLFLAAVILDIIDGRVARMLKQDSREGVLLDVMADKIIIISAFLTAGVKINFVFFYLGLLMLLRENSMDAMRFITILKGQAVLTDRLSKTKYILYIVSVLGIMVNAAFLDNNLYLQNIVAVFAIVVMVFAYVTWVRFFILNKKSIVQ